MYFREISTITSRRRVELMKLKQSESCNQ